jgi:hypothetical protein
MKLQKGEFCEFCVFRRFFSGGVIFLQTFALAFDGTSL